ncbi:MAG: hypothetical protein AB1345_08365 [Chloroflexota bacterium]
MDIDIEQHLGSALHPVKPRPEFVRGLREILVGSAPGTTRWQIPVISMEGIKKAVLILVGIASGTLLIINGLRAVVALLAALGLLQQVKKQVKEQSVQPSTMHTAS